MEGIVFSGKDCVKPVKLPKPTVSCSTDVVVKVEVAGLCGSDLHPYHEKEKGLDHGCVMGHEFVGTIHEVGSAVSRLRIGDRVCTPFTTNCGECFYCKEGLTCRCVHGRLFGWRENGVGLHGGQAEYVLVEHAEATLVKVPEDVESEVALFVGDILSTGFHVATMADIERRPDGAYAVVGCGPVGMMALICAREISGDRATLIAVDSVPERLERARDLGAVALDFTKDDVASRARELTDGRGVDGILEAVGSSAAVMTGYKMMRPGGTLSSIGVNTDTHLPFSPSDAYDKNITFRSGRCPARNYMGMEKLWDAARKNSETLKGIVTHRLPLSEAQRAYEMFDKRENGCTKVVFLPGK